MIDQAEYPIWIGDSIFAALCQMAEIPAAEQPRPKGGGPRQKDILAFLRAHPGANTFDVAAHIGKSARTILTYMASMEKQGQLRSERGRPNRWWAR